ncbi:MAG: hypothetical protein AAFR24_12680 [Cyanobacteria bacterium J06627_3]
MVTIRAFGYQVPPSPLISWSGVASLITFLGTASGISFFGIGPAFWGILADVLATVAFQVNDQTVQT